MLRKIISVSNKRVEDLIKRLDNTLKINEAAESEEVKDFFEIKVRDFLCEIDQGNLETTVLFEPINLERLSALFFHPDALNHIGLKHYLTQEEIIKCKYLCPIARGTFEWTDWVTYICTELKKIVPDQEYLNEIEVILRTSLNIKPNRLRDVVQQPMDGLPDEADLNQENDLEQQIPESCMRKYKMPLLSLILVLPFAILGGREDIFKFKEFEKSGVGGASLMAGIVSGWKTSAYLWNFRTEQVALHNAFLFSIPACLLNLCSSVLQNTESFKGYYDGEPTALPRLAFSNLTHAILLHLSVKRNDPSSGKEFIKHFVTFFALEILQFLFADLVLTYVQEPDCGIESSGSGSPCKGSYDTGIGNISEKELIFGAMCIPLLSFMVAYCGRKHQQRSNRRERRADIPAEHRP